MQPPTDTIQYFPRGITFSHCRHYFYDRLESFNILPVQMDHWFLKLTTHYDEPQRHYHTLSHISWLLHLFTHSVHAFESRSSVLLAIFFHDIIYDPTRSDNEVQSVVLFEDFVRDVGKIPNETAGRVVTMIRATILHREDPELPTSRDTCLFLDMDLDVLSFLPPAYLNYTRQIRKEYGHYADQAYVKGRTAVMRSLLDKEKLYFGEGTEDKEGRARGNISRELVRLQILSGEKVAG